MLVAAKDSGGKDGRDFRRSLFRRHALWIVDAVHGVSSAAQPVG
jgi:hypothetical protein